MISQIVIVISVFYIIGMFVTSISVLRWFERDYPDSDEFDYGLSVVAGFVWPLVLLLVIVIQLFLLLGRVVKTISDYLR